MDNRTRLTKSAVEDAELREKEYVLWDTSISGFGLRVRPSGGKSFVFTYRTAGGRAGRVQRVTIGNAAKMKVDVAREKAKGLAGQHHGGVDPAADIAAAAITGFCKADVQLFGPLQAYVAEAAVAVFK